MRKRSFIGTDACGHAPNIGPAVRTLRGACLRYFHVSRRVTALGPAPLRARDDEPGTRGVLVLPWAMRGTPVHEKVLAKCQLQEDEDVAWDWCGTSSDCDCDLPKVCAKDECSCNRARVCTSRRCTREPMNIFELHTEKTKEPPVARTGAFSRFTQRFAARCKCGRLKACADIDCDCDSPKVYRGKAQHQGSRRKVSASSTASPSRAPQKCTWCTTAIASVRCIKCSRYFCASHIEECRRCGQRLCKYEFWPQSYYCEPCYREWHAGRAAALNSCNVCGGSGKLLYDQVSQYMYQSTYQKVARTCYNCGGSGSKR